MNCNNKATTFRQFQKTAILTETHGQSYSNKKTSKEYSMWTTNNNHKTLYGTYQNNTSTSQSKR